MRRRAVLAGAASGIAATSGCLGELRNLAGRQRTQQLSLTVATLPAAEDPYAVRITNQLVENLQLAGIDAASDVMSPEALFQEILINHDFDMYVARYPQVDDPDALRSLLHSTYGEEAGWQNPFGFSDLTMDELLDEQRRVDSGQRVELLQEIQERTIEEQPFTVVAFPDQIAGYRTDRFDRWPEGGPTESADYLTLNRVSDVDTLELLLRDTRITRNRNPIAVEHRQQGIITGLLYEPLARRLGDDTELTPWLARDIEWQQERDSLVATVSVRETPWHDGEPVTAADVAFTYDFMQDTSLGEFDTPVPTPWRRGRVSLVDSASVLGERELQMTFTTPKPEVARRAFTVPILPEHIWSEQTDPADIAGLDIVGRTTEALVWQNEEAIGSGPAQFVEASADEHLLLESFEPHFLNGEAAGIPEQFVGGLPFEQVQFVLVPSHEAAIQLLEDDEADGTADGLQASIVPRIVRNNELTLSVTGTDSFYHVGYNSRRAPLSNPHFRRTVGRMVDRTHIVGETFEGYARPAEVPLDTAWGPPGSRWDGEATLPFFGEEGTGELDVSAARDAFREAGYRYDDDRLITRGEQ